MSYNPLVIGSPYQTGLVTSYDDDLIPPDGFSTFTNGHINLGRIEKRNGYRFLSWLTHSPQLSITNISQADPAVVSLSSAAGLSNGMFIVITNVSGMTEVNNNRYKVANLSGTNFDLQDEDGNNVDSTGFTAYSTGGVIAQAPGNRVMGLYRYFDPDGSKSTLGFDTERACIYDVTNDRFNPLDTADIFDGSETDYIWATNWQHSDSDNRLYFTNGKVYDGATLNGIRYFSNPSGSSTTTTSFVPNLNTGGTRKLYGCKLIFAIRDRLVVLYTYEHDTGTGTTTTHPQRARWCQAQGPSNWNDVVPGGGGRVDAPTGEQIISAQQFQDQVIVFFSNSVWALVPYSDPALPFRWQQLNDFRACDGKMATAGYDQYVSAVGVRGITVSDTTQTRRVDDKIRNFSVNVINVDQFQKTFSFRDYANNHTWTLYADRTSDEVNNALIYDETSQSWSNYEIAMNVLGYSNNGEDFGLDDFIAANDLDMSIEDFEQETLQSYFWQADQETMIGGDISGKVYIMKTEGDDDGTDINLELETGDLNPFKQQGTESQLGFVDLYIDTDSRSILNVEFFKNDERYPIISKITNCMPNLTELVSINNISQANPAVVSAGDHGLSTGDVIYIYNVDGMKSINGGPYTITRINNNQFSLDSVDSTSFSSYTTGGVITENEFYRTKVWKRIYGGATGYSHRIKISCDGQDKPLVLHGMKAYFRPIGKRTIG